MAESFYQDIIFVFYFIANIRNFQKNIANQKYILIKIELIELTNFVQVPVQVTHKRQKEQKTIF